MDGRTQERVGPGRAMLRGLAKRCPQCGQAPIFKGFYRIRPNCMACGFEFRGAPDDHVGVLYITTAIQTAMLAAFVLVFEPGNAWLARGILGVFALVLFFLNMPNRKGLAIALDYLTGAVPRLDEPQ